MVNNMPRDRPPKYEIVEDTRSIEENEFYKIRRIFKRREHARKILLQIIKKEPCRVGEIRERVSCTRKTLYDNIATLQKFGLIERIPVINAMEDNNQSYIKQKVKEKFDRWSDTMPPKTRNYYMARTGYYIITEKGEKFIDWIAKIEGIKVRKRPTLRDWSKEESIFEKLRKGKGKDLLQ